MAAVEYLNGHTDEERIAESKHLFVEKALTHSADGFEVWDGPRFVYRFPES